jgi:16S rRNA C1402 N4-methylase RsmH
VVNASSSVQVHVDCTLGAGGHAEALIRQHPVGFLTSVAFLVHE